jgi:hypothetical protein
MKTSPTQRRAEIETLLRAVGSRHDRLRAVRVLFIAIPAGATVAALGSLFWVGQGRAVPGIFLTGICIITAMAALISWWIGRMVPSAAAVEADRVFGLKDAITSARYLAATQPDDSATALQWQWLQPRLKECDPQVIREPFPKRRAWVSVALLAAVAWLGLLPPSPEIQAAEEAARETKARVAESKEQLEELIKELEKEIVAPEEKEALKLDEFRKMVKSIEETGDRKEAARQFARIEQKIRDTTKALEQRRDEETLQMAAAELAKAEQTEPRQIGKKLEAKELKEAAEMLNKLAARKLDPKDLKNAKGTEKKSKIKEAKNELARMRAVTKRMAAAGKQRQGARQAQAGQGQGSQSQAGGESGESGGEQGKALEDLMAELDDAAAEMEKELSEMEIDPDAMEGDGEAMARANGAMGKLTAKMRAMHGKRMAQSKLDQLRQGLAAAQGFAQGSSQMLGLAGQGGRQPGVGSSWNERQEKDDSQKNGQLAELKGQHGSGPSLSSVEESESGTGVSGLRGEAKQRDFARQTESFVQRDDVPEALKLGVRNYFESLQSAEAATPPPSK